METHAVRTQRYEYRPRGRRWAIYLMTYTEHGGTGTKVDEKDTWEEARKEVYRLNGWKFKQTGAGK